MGLVITTTAALCLMIVLWSLNLSGLDGLLIAIAIVLIAIGVRAVLPSGWRVPRSPGHGRPSWGSSSCSGSRSRVAAGSPPAPER